jgi:AbrB family looped-hinge helix DNA binding protein
MERVTTIDQVGRLVIPEELRVRHHLHAGSRLRVAEAEGRIVLEPIEEPTPLVERGGLLLVEAPLEGPAVDHRQLREERLQSLAGRSE